MSKCEKCGEFPKRIKCPECGKDHIVLSYWEYLGMKEDIKEVANLQKRIGSLEKIVRSLEKEKVQLFKKMQIATPGVWGICEYCGKIDAICPGFLRNTKDGLFHHHCYQQVCKNKKRGRGVISA